MSKKPNEPSRQDVWKMFDRISPTYDRVNRVMSFGIDQSWRKKLCALLPENRELDVLDCATGTGDQIIALLEKRPKIRSVIGLDLAEAMMAIGKEKIAAKPYANKVNFIRASAQELPFSNERFDAITISFGIRNVESVEKALIEFYRVLKPSGKLLILEGTIPTNPLWKALHLFYLRFCMPRIGGIFSKQPQAYRYLNETIETFPQGKAFCQLLLNAGFSQVKADPCLGGIATVYSGERNGDR